MPYQVSDNDIDLYRNARHSITQRVLNVVPRTVVAKATIAANPSSNPISQLTVTWTEGDASDVEEDQLVFIGTTDGAYDVAVTGLRSGSSGTTLMINGQSQGDSSTPRTRGNILRAIQAGQYVTIIRTYPLLATISRLAGGQYYKKFNKAYTGQLRSLDPVCNIGPWDAKFVDGSGTATFTFSAADSFTWQGKTIVSWSWDLDGGTLLSGALDEESCSAVFDPGFYIISCTIRDTHNRSHKARKYIWVNTYEGEHAPFSLRYGLDITTIKETRRGGEMSFVLHDNTHVAEVYPYAGFLYTERALYDGQETEYSGQFRRFVGYLGSLSQTATRPRTQREYTIQSPLVRASALPNPPQQFTESPLPANWNQMPVSNPATAAWYELYYHVPSLIANHDFLISGDYADLRKQSFVWQGEGVGPHLSELEQLYLGNIGSRADGASMLCAGPQHREQAYRNAMPQIYEWTEDDIVGTIQFGMAQDSPNAATTGYSFAYNGGKEAIPYGAIAPGRTQMQGVGKPTMSTFIVPAVNGQYITQKRVAHEHARLTADVPSVRLVANRNIDIGSAADLTSWHVLNLPDLEEALGTVPRALVSSVTRQYRRGGLKTVTYEFEIETYSEIAGEPIPILRSGANSFLFDGWTLPMPDFFDPYIAPDFDTDGTPLDDAKVIMRTDQNHIAVTQNFLDKTVQWQRISDDLDAAGIIHDMALNYQGLLYVACWQEEDEEATIWRCDPFVSSPAWTLIHTWTISDSNSNLKLKLSIDPVDEFPYGVSWITPNGLFVIRARQSGETLPTRPVEQIASANGSTSKRAGSGRKEAFYVLSGATTGTPDYDIYASSGTGSWDITAARPGDFNREPSATLQPINDNTFFVTLDIVDNTPGATTISNNVIDGAVDLPGSEGLYRSSLQPGATGNLVNYGIYQAYRRFPLGKSMTVTEFSGALGNSQWFNSEHAPSGYPLRGRFMLMDRFLRTLWISEYQDWTSMDPDITSINYFPNPSAYEVVGYSSSVSFSHVFTTPLEDVAYIGVELQALQPIAASYVIRPSFPLNPYPGFSLSFSYELDITNIREEGRRLYRLTGPTGSTSWYNITPATGHVPDREYGAHADPENGSLMAMAGIDEDGGRALLTSDNMGTGWFRRQEEFYTGAQRYGDCVVAWGFTRLELSDDKGVTMFNRLGDYAKSVGQVGTIEQVILP